jgi:cytochrome c biogenesis protein CcdA
MELLLITGAAALVDSINPCAFSVLFLTIAFLFNLEKSRVEVVKIGSIYIFGIFLTYILIGLGILQVLDIFGVPRIATKIGGGIIILFGLIQLLGALWKNFPIKLKIPDSAHGKIAEFIHKGSIPSAFILGVFVGLVEFPCTGGPYLYVLALLHDAKTISQNFVALGYLLWYNLLFISPLVVVLFLASTQKSAEIINKIRKSETKRSKILVALVMMALGTLVFFV